MPIETGWTSKQAGSLLHNSLKHHGWKPGMTRQQQYQVILKYNYSKPYANTILDIAARLRDG